MVKEVIRVIVVVVAVALEFTIVGLGYLILGT